MFPFCFHLIQKYQKQIIIIIIIKQKTTFVEIEKLKKDIESKDNQILKIKQKIQVKQTQIIQQQENFEQKNKQINENKEEQKENIINDDSSLSIINTSSTLDFELVRSFKLNKTFTGHTSYVWSIDYSTFDDCQFICSGSNDKTVRIWDVDNNKQVQSFNGHSDQ
ncbi:WD-40 repeat protein, partial [Reticulomyxa filosa]